ncbi:MAG TPA: hypothetical protein VHG10_11455 [Glycomyces sp.]|nr:hypothetical protein [Glycomyces sp.]
MRTQARANAFGRAGAANRGGRADRRDRSPRPGYGIAYGSQATGFGSPTSDLDILYVVGVDVAESTKLGALTGPHLFPCGDLTRYRRDLDAAIRAVAVLTSAMLAHKPTTTGDDVRSALLTHPSGATGKDYLGYQHGPALERLARSVLAELVTLRIARLAGRGIFEHRHPVVSDLLARPAATALV